MISRQEIESLAELSRLKLSGKEIDELREECSAILDYVAQIRDASIDSEGLAGEDAEAPSNVMREDTPRGADDPLFGKRKSLLAAAPVREGDYVAVRKILEKEQ